jgi:type I restriction enzyme S subunit
VLHICNGKPNIRSLFTFIPKNFLFYYFSFFDWNKETEGDFKVKGRTLNKEKLKALNIILPPLSEQKRIVAILDRTFKAIDQAKTNAEQNLKNAKELFESYLNRIFEEKGDDWEVKKLGEIGKVSMCKRILKKQTTQIGEIPFYKIGTFGKKPNAYISKKIYDDYKSKYSFPKKGDILLSASGTIGRCVIYNGKPAYFQDSNIVWIGNNEKEVTNEYLYNFYGFCDWNPSKGATISRLYNDDLRRIIIPFPKSKEEQKQIVAQLDKLQTETKKLEIIYQQKINNLVELKKSILQKAFKGEL